MSKAKNGSGPSGPFDFYEATPIVDEVAFVEEIKREYGLTHEEATRVLQQSMNARIVKSTKYQVSIFDKPGNGFSAGDMVHLSIKRIDRGTIHDWRDLQQIKNALVGPECEAFEMYPAESRLVDSANQYHLWCFKDPEVRIPCGFAERLVDSTPISGSVNRPFSPEHKARGYSGRSVLDAANLRKDKREVDRKSKEEGEKLLRLWHWAVDEYKRRTQEIERGVVNIDWATPEYRVSWTEIITKAVEFGITVDAVTLRQWWQDHDPKHEVGKR